MVYMSYRNQININIMFMWKLKALVIFRHLTKSAKWSIKPLGIKKDKAEFCLVTQTLIKQTAELYTISRWVIGVMKIKILFNPNWHEAGYFYTLVILGLDFVS